MSPFIEKMAYDYKHEANELEAHHHMNQHSPHYHVGRNALKGGAFGAGIGAGLSATFGRRKLKSHAGGAALGAGFTGLMSGLLTAKANEDTAESKRIMSMKPSHRKDYLRHQARIAESRDS